MPRSAAVVRLTGNNQISIPKHIRDELGIKLGDLFAPSVERGAVVLRPKVLVDPGFEAAQRARAGIGVSRAYDNADEFIADLKTAAKRHRKPLARKAPKK